MSQQPITLFITGMSCSHCLNAVNRALSSLAGVTVDQVRIGRADLRFDESLITPEQIRAAVEDEGYDARIEQVTHG
jgi:copper chaperone